MSGDTAAAVDQVRRFNRTVTERVGALSDRFLGGSYQSLPVDQSEKRLCEGRCLALLDDMNNWAPGRKYMLAEGDTYMKYPDDETYPQLIVNYVKLPLVLSVSFAPPAVNAGVWLGSMTSLSPAIGTLSWLKRPCSAGCDSTVFLDTWKV